MEIVVGGIICLFVSVSCCWYIRSGYIVCAFIELGMVSMYKIGSNDNY